MGSWSETLQIRAGWLEGRGTHRTVKSARKGRGGTEGLMGVTDKQECQGGLWEQLNLGEADIQFRKHE